MNVMVHICPIADIILQLLLKWDHWKLFTSKNDPFTLPMACAYLELVNSCHVYKTDKN